MNEHVERRDPTRRWYRYSGPLRCTECGVFSDERAAGWRGYRTDEPESDDTPEVVWYCAYCAIREFG
jgi:hypothetical protein